MKTQALGAREFRLESESPDEMMLLRNLHTALRETQDARIAVFDKAVGPFRPGIVGRLYSRVFRPNRSLLWKEWTSIGPRLSSSLFHDGSLILSIRIRETAADSAQTER